MKKLLVSVLALLVLVGCGSSSAGGKESSELRVFNWGEYIDKDLVKEFEKENNVKVIYEVFESNEAMYIKLQSGEKYDVIIPSDYMVQRLREEGKLQKIDYSKITNYENTLANLRGRKMDPQDEYTVPYFWGSVGIVYDKTKVDPALVEAQGWDILRNQDYKGRLYFYDSERDAFMIALKALGYSMNSTDEKEIEAAYEWLIALGKEMKPTYVADEVIDGMVTGVMDLAVMYSGDASYVLSENPNMAYHEPKQGTNTWVDTMVIPSDAQNVEMAHKWINFMISNEGSKRITKAIGYTSPIQKVIDEVTGPNGTYEGVSSYIPRSGYDKDEEFFYDAKMKALLSEYWTKIKASK
ncbi:ABC transporter substrate-binding protein [Erysipelothrix sp. HDW6A]|uniref:ABC transporter substrate-binding protein n=1 Tax=Erysipelothrix sp. HDW6A TaxID=2714928 RepID=UPI00140B0B4B|nr:ABC transporter substrate-binding protein [Erysipelothrix sp. HDW6A]QIK56376.1 ABC transporter substrate-binding protein [Erysipelothrix sp. HDW6A]